MNSKKSRKTPGAPAVLMISVLLLMMLPLDTVGRVFRMLTRGSGGWRFIVHYPQQLLVFLAFVVLLAIAIVSFLRLMGLAGKKQNEKRPSAPSTRPAPRKQQPGQPVVSTLPRIPLHRNTPPEDAIHCEHKNGREKYLDQINGFLKNGLIDRAEYNLLKERYERLDIPDDYHG